MNKNDFYQLKEVQSLVLHQQQALNANEIEKKRLLTLEIKIKDRKAEVENDFQSLKNNIKKLQELESKYQMAQKTLDKNKQRMPQLLNESEIKATLKEITHSEQQISFLDPEILNLMESIETLQNKQKQDQIFLAGIAKTKEELSSEVQKNIQINLKKIQEFKIRFDSLIETLPTPMKSRYLLLHEQNPNQVHLVTIINGACSACKMTIGRREQSVVERGQELESCLHCGRILMPSNL